MDFKLNKSNLNFRVYTAASLPETGQENDICIVSDVPMKNWILSPDAPKGTPRNDGDVWIRYAVTGKTFNALKNGAMVIATISAMQCIDGAWVKKIAKSYRNGEWVDWITYVLRSGADEIGLEKYQYQGASRSETAGDDYIEFTTKTTASGSYASSTYGRATSSPVDLTDVTTIYAKINVINGGISGGNSWGAGINVATEKNQSSRVKKVTQPASGEGIMVVDVSDLTGLYYITFGAYAYIDKSGSATGTVRFYDVYWE